MSLVGRIRSFGIKLSYMRLIPLCANWKSKISRQGPLARVHLGIYPFQETSRYLHHPKSSLLSWLVAYKYNHRPVFGRSPRSHYIKMSGCTLQFTKNSSTRTTLIDEATGHVKYKVETPIKASHVVTRIRKFENHAYSSPFNLDDDDDYDHHDDLADEKMEDQFSDEMGREEISLHMPEVSDEMARIYWKLVAADEIVFRGKVHIRSEVLPKCGKMKGWVGPRHASGGESD